MERLRCREWIFKKSKPKKLCQKIRRGILGKGARAAGEPNPMASDLDRSGTGLSDGTRKQLMVVDTHLYRS
jgi:hypothetical protein